MKRLVLVAVLAMPCLCRAADEPKYQGRPLSHWFNVLEKPAVLRDDERWVAAGVLAKLSPADHAGLPWILERLKSRACDGRSHEMFALRRIGPPSVAALTEMLKEDDKDARVAAALALAELSPHSQPALPQLTRLLKD